MKMQMLAAGTLVFLGLASLSSMGAVSQADAQYRVNRAGARVVLPAGTPINVSLNTKLSTEHAHTGDAWSGTVTEPVYYNGRVMIPAGSAVEGSVTHTAQGTHNDRAQLSLSMRRASVSGQMYSLNADTPPIVAGTRRAKKLGAVLGGAAVGALLGNIVGGKKSTIVGGVAGGAAGYGLTRHGMRTLVLKPGTVVSFTTSEAMVAQY
ncbi:MAG: hypothetical protein ABIS67_01265 [Candidatus Eisenbacteria bacterium]